MCSRSFLFRAPTSPLARKSERCVMFGHLRETPRRFLDTALLTSSRTFSPRQNPTFLPPQLFLSSRKFFLRPLEFLRIPTPFDFRVHPVSRCGTIETGFLRLRVLRTFNRVTLLELGFCVTLTRKGLISWILGTENNFLVLRRDC